MFARIFMALVSIGVLGAICVTGAVVWLLFYYGRDLPDYHQLENYQPPIVTRVYSDDGRLVAEFATEKRVFVPIKVVPPLVINAFLSAEDKNFWTHPGLDMQGIIRSIVTNVQNIGSGKRPKGASTITQQVARNFFLSNEVSIARKIKEALLSFRMEKTFSKERILELYLNQIYLGKGTYGVMAAALEYFNKTLDELTIEEAAYLAALPKAPSNYDPQKHYQAALDRRNWVIARMEENGHITDEEAKTSTEQPLKTFEHDTSGYVTAASFAEEVRRQIKEKYGDKGLYEGGYLVQTSLNPKYQDAAERALQKGLIDYDSRFGLHAKPIAHFSVLKDWEKQLGAVERPAGAGPLKMAVVLESKEKTASIGLVDGSKGVIPYEKMKWARSRPDGCCGPEIKAVYEVLKPGDVILVEPAAADAKQDPKKKKGNPEYWFRQIPDVQGGVVVMDPHTGRVLAMAGGFSYELSEFNRASQALRQPGSAFKPFIYLSALENGFTPATLVLDAPFVLDQGPGLGKWKPSNYTGEFYGPTPLRVGMEKSRNLMTVRLASHIGMDKVSEIAKRFGVIDDMPPMLSMAIGAGETTLLKMTSAYCIFANGGKKVSPTLIDRIQDRFGKTVLSSDTRPCENCGPRMAWEGQPTPDIPDTREQIADPRHVYQMTSIMEGVVQRGTATLLKELNRPIAGKTGTTNDSKDTWFIGYTPDLVIGVYIGFDNPRSMGKKETGGKVAAPVFKQFVQEQLADVPAVPFRVPDGIRLVQVNADLGTRAKPGDANVIWEAFLEGTEPGENPIMFDGTGFGTVSDLTQGAGATATTGTGGLY